MTEPRYHASVTDPDETAPISPSKYEGMRDEHDRRHGDSGRERPGSGDRSATPPPPDVEARERGYAARYLDPSYPLPSSAPSSQPGPQPSRRPHGSSSPPPSSAPSGPPDPFAGPAPSGRSDPSGRPDALGRSDPSGRPDAFGRPDPLSRPDPAAPSAGRAGTNGRPPVGGEPPAAPNLSQALNAGPASRAGTDAGRPPAMPYSPDAYRPGLGQPGPGHAGDGGYGPPPGYPPGSPYSPPPGIDPDPTAVTAYGAALAGAGLPGGAGIAGAGLAGAGMSPTGAALGAPPIGAPPVGAPGVGGRPGSYGGGPTVGSGRAASRAAARSGARGRPARRARLTVRHIDPWSTLKFSLVLSVAMFFVWLVAVGVLYGVLDGMGVFDNVNNLYDELAGSGGERLITGGMVLGTALLVGAVNIVLFTALATVGAFVYNICSDLVGGIEVTLAERE
jgi:Transmembrane domain of unknown function (DUF3566)